LSYINQKCIKKEKNENFIVIAEIDIFMSKKIPEWVEEILLPKLNEIDNSIKALESEFEQKAGTEVVGDKIESLGREAKSDIESLGKDTKREFESLRNELTGLGNVITSLRNETLSKFDTIDARIAGVRNELITKFEAVDFRFQSLDSRLDSLEERISVMEKIAEFDARLAELEKNKDKNEH